MLKHVLRVLVLVVIVAAVIVYFYTRPDVARLPVEAVAGWKPAITPAREQSFPTNRIAKAVGWPAGAAPTPAAGLKVAAFASGLDHPRRLLLLPNGDVLVAETNSPPRAGGGLWGWAERTLMGRAGAGVPSANRITLLRDTNGDGVADERHVLIGGLNSPYGMALAGGMLYIGDTDALLRVSFTPGQTAITAKPEKVIDLPGGGNHWTRDVIASPDGKLLYVGVGSSTNIADDGIDAERNRADVLEVNPATKTFRIFAAGTRNPTGLTWDAKTNRLWASVQERDMLGSDLAPDYISALELGDFFGWPYSYWGGYVDKRVQPERPDLLSYTKRPDYAMGPHVAVMSLIFAPAAAMGSGYPYGAFVSEHGSWNRVPVSGYKVVYVPFDGAYGFPVKGPKPQDVLTGFLDADGNARGRPVGLAFDKGGALLVADDVGNRIWRVSAR